MANEVEILKNDSIVHEANTGADEPANLDLAQQHAVITLALPRLLFTGAGAGWNAWDNTNLPCVFIWRNDKYEFRAKP